MGTYKLFLGQMRFQVFHDMRIVFLYHLRRILLVRLEQPALQDIVGKRYVGCLLKHQGTYIGKKRIIALRTELLFQRLFHPIAKFGFSLHRSFAEDLIIQFPVQVGGLVACDFFDLETEITGNTRHFFLLYIQERCDLRFGSFVGFIRIENNLVVQFGTKEFVAFFFVFDILGHEHGFFDPYTAGQLFVPLHLYYCTFYKVIFLNVFHIVVRSETSPVRVNLLVYQCIVNIHFIPCQFIAFRQFDIEYRCQCDVEPKLKILLCVEVDRRMIGAWHRLSENSDVIFTNVIKQTL